MTAVAGLRPIERLRGLESKTLIMGVAIAVVAFLSLVPLAMLVWGSLWSAGPGEAGGFTLDNYVRAYANPETYRLFYNTLIYAAGGTILAIAIGTTFAWLVERTDIPGKRVLYTLMVLPLVVPGVVNGVAWQLLLSPRIGFVNRILMQAFGLENPPFDIYSMGGMIFLEGIGMSLLVFLLMSAAFKVMDPALEEAATTSGAGTLTTLRRVTLRLMFPALLSVFLIIFIRALESFEIPALVGLPGRVVVFTTQIYLAFRKFPPDFGLATALAVSLMTASVIGVYIYSRVTSRAEKYTTVTGKGYRPKLVRLGHWRWPALGLFAIYETCTVGLVLLILVWGSLFPYYSVPSLARLGKVSLGGTLEVYGKALTYSGVAQGIFNTFIVAIVTATAAMVITAVIAWIVVRTKARGRQSLDMVTFLPVAFPGIVLGVALMWVYLTLPIGVYGTLSILILAYLTRYIPYGIRSATGSMIQVHRELEEAAGISGASWLQTFVRVTLPLLWPGLVAGWIYIMLLSFRELSASILLYGPGSQVLSVMIFDMWEAGYPQLVSALGVMMVVVMGVLVMLLQKLGGQRIAGG